tara:strand:- start:463 stop:969 length:507 start_codon:yes stop_codon:yes gene_type:complete
MRKLRNNASDNLQEIRNSNRKTADQLISSLKKILLGSKQSAETPKDKLALIEQSLPDDIDATIEAFDQHLIYADDNDLPLILKYYKSKRSIMFRLLRQLEIRVASKDVLIENLVEFILSNQRSHGDNITINIEEFANLEWLDEQWFKFMVLSKLVWHMLKYKNNHNGF